MTQTQAGELPLPEVEEHFAYWHEFPPPHISLRMLAMAMAGWKPPQPKPTGPFKPSSEDEVRDLIAAVNGA